MRLINADACIDYIRNNNQHAWEALAYAPTIDAVEVVRCEDCELWTEEKDEEDDILYGWCRAPFENDNLLVYGDDATRIFTAYDFFCKSGKRRKNERSEAKET